MTPSRKARLLAAGAGMLLASACSPRAGWMRDESDRITADMRPEPYTAQTPGAAGIQLGDDAPPLAPPFSRGDSVLYPLGIVRTVPAEGSWGRNWGHGLRPRVIIDGHVVGAPGHRVGPHPGHPVGAPGGHPAGGGGARLP